MFRQRVIPDLAIMHESPRLCTDAAILMYSKRLDANNALAGMTSVLDITGTALPTSMTNVAGGEGCVRRSALATKNERN